MNLLGKTLANRYEIIEQIGEGGMAYVYKAKCNLLNRYVAVKVLKEEFAKDELFVKRFRAEAQSAASLTHPNIVSVYDVGKEDGISYIVMELLESKTLKDYIELKGKLDNETALKISIQIASALEAAHRAHVIHRDIKPHNIVLNKNLVAKVTDFGIAKVSSSATITNFGNTMGSVHYFSPEHAKGGFTDEKSDIYSLGVVMYEMVTGKVPFDADSPVSVALKHVQEEPIPPNEVNPVVSKPLNHIILKCMAKNTVDRYKNATELLDDLNLALMDPDRMLQKSKGVIDAGATQVIPIIGMRDLERPKTIEKKESNTLVGSRRNTPMSRREYLRNENKETNIDSESIKENKDINKNDETKKKMSKKKKLMIIYISALSVILLVILIVFGGKIINKLKGTPVELTEIVVPNLIGRNYQEAKEEYARQEIEVIQQKEEYNSEFEAGIIVSQDKEKGTTTTDKKIKVVVSKGENLVKVPDVTTKDFKVAKYELETTNGFKVEVEVVNEKIAEGVVILQEPEKDTEAAYGSTVKLKVSKGDGKEKVIMPNVIGKTKEVAKSELEALKLTVKLEETKDTTKTNGVVIEQSYPQNQELKEGDLVTLKYNRYPVQKTLTYSLSKLIGSDNTKQEDKTQPTTVKEYSVKVNASIDGGATNTIYNQTQKESNDTISVTVNGYSEVKIYIYIDNVLKKEETVKLT